MTNATSRSSPSWLELELVGLAVQPRRRFASSSATKAMKVKEGDELLLVEGPDGFRITPFDTDFERQMKVAEKVLTQRAAPALEAMRKEPRWRGGPGLIG